MNVFVSDRLIIRSIRDCSAIPGYIPLSLTSVLTLVTFLSLKVFLYFYILEQKVCETWKMTFTFLKYGVSYYCHYSLPHVWSAVCHSRCKMMSRYISDHLAFDVLFVPAWPTQPHWLTYSKCWLKSEMSAVCDQAGHTLTAWEAFFSQMRKHLREDKEAFQQYEIYFFNQSNTNLRSFCGRFVKYSPLFTVHR